MNVADRNEVSAQPQAGEGETHQSPPSCSETITHPAMKRILQRTPEEWQRIAESRKAHEAEIAARERRQRITDAHLPELLMAHREAVLKSPTLLCWQQKLEILDSLIRGGQGGLFAIVGTYRTGKSQMGVELAYRVTETASALFTQAQRMVVSIKDAWHSYRESVSGQMDKFIKPPFLVIDEVNAGRYLDDIGIDYLQGIITERFDYRKSTLLISNETKASFEALVGERIIGRLNESGGIVEADWPPFTKGS